MLLDEVLFAMFFVSLVKFITHAYGDGSVLEVVTSKLLRTPASVQKDAAQLLSTENPVSGALNMKTPHVCLSTLSTHLKVSVVSSYRSRTRQFFSK